MPQYRISLHVNQPIPDEWRSHTFRFENRPYFLAKATQFDGVTIEPVEADDGDAAIQEGRRLFNALLNYMAVVDGKSRQIETGNYAYQNVDVPSDGHVYAQVAGFVSIGVFGFHSPREHAIASELVACAFVRRAEIAADPFNKYRNYFLAIERIAKVCLEYDDFETSLIKCTLRRVASTAEIQELRRRLESVATEDDRIDLSGNAVENLNENIYKRWRCAMNHSGKDSDLHPFNPDDEAFVEAGLPLIRNLALIYARLEIRSTTP